MVNRATTAVPTISAEALAAMRRGLRIALRRARRPVKPRVDAAPVPSTAAAGRATTGPSTTAPTSTPRAPRPARPRAPSSDVVAVMTVATPAAAMSDTGDGPDDRGRRAVDGDVAQGGERRDP